jgi:MOSC domain-containing protein YiiM
MPPHVVTVNVVFEVRPDPGGDVGRTAIDKRPVAGPVEVQELGLVGDSVLDRDNHGGRDQAVYAYAAEDLGWWAAHLGRPLPPGTFGENLTVAGLDVTGAVIGERWVVDGADGSPAVVLQVTCPRVPCTTFQAWMREPQWVRRFTEHRAPGAYLRVLQPGRVAAGSPIAVADRPRHGVTIGDVFPLRQADPDRLRRLLDTGDDLAPSLVRAVEAELRLVERRPARAAADAAP